MPGASASGKRGSIENAVARVVGRDSMSVADLDRIAYGRDMWPRDQLVIQGGELPKGPAVVAWPRNREEVSELVALANRRAIPIVPFGGGSGVCGAARAGEGALVIDVKRMKKVRSVDPDRLVADVETGINGEWLERDLNRRGYTLGHFPSSIYCSTLGGFIAARSAGQLSTRYGKMEDMLAGLELVLPDGEPVDLPEWEPASGANMNQLFCGSEGTLGVLTAAQLRVHHLAEQRELMAFEFEDIGKGLSAIQEMLQAGLRPAVVRLYDEFDTILALSGGGEESFVSLLNPKRVASELLGLFPSLSRRALSLVLGQPRALNMLADVIGGRCLLVLMAEGPAELTAAEARECSRVASDCGGRSLGSAPAEHWLERRYAVSYKQSKVFASGAFNDTAEVAGTWDVLGQLYRNVKRAIGKHAFVMAHFSHAYHEGCSIYFTFVGNGGSMSRSQELYDRIWNDLLAATLESGGTISHHHGVGRSKAHFLPDELGEGGMALLKETKEALDPRAVLNIGSLGLNMWTEAEPATARKSRTSAFEQQLSALLGSENLREGRLARSFLGLDSEHPGEPVIVSPGAASEVTELMTLVHEYRVPLVVAGSTGRGLDVPRLPDGYYVVLDTARLDRVLSVDDDSLTVTAQAGISWAALEQSCNQQGYTLGFPGGVFAEEVSMGGVLSTGLPPMVSPRYGSAPEAVVNLGFVCADGVRVRTKLTPRSATGPDLTSIAMGGRGALAIITGATLRVYERPEVRHVLVHRFDRASDGLRALWSVLADDIRPATARMWREDGRSALGVIVEGSAATARIERDRILEACEAAGGSLGEDTELPDYVKQLLVASGDALLCSGSYAQLAAASDDPHCDRVVFPVLAARFGYALLDPDTEDPDRIAEVCKKAGLRIVDAPGRTTPIDPGTLEVMRRLKRRLDPDDLLNPGLIE